MKKQRELRAPLVRMAVRLVKESGLCAGLEHTTILHTANNVIGLEFFGKDPGPNFVERVGLHLYGQGVSLTLREAMWIVMLAIGPVYKQDENGNVEEFLVKI